MKKKKSVFMARFASIPPRTKPEDWQKVREKTREQVARESAGLKRSGEEDSEIPPISEEMDKLP